MANKNDIASDELIKKAIEDAQTDCEARLESEQDDRLKAVNELIAAFIERELDLQRNGVTVPDKHKYGIDTLFKKAEEHAQNIQGLERRREGIRQIAKRPGDLAKAITFYPYPDQS